MSRIALGRVVEFGPDHMIDALPPANWNPETVPNHALLVAWEATAPAAYALDNVRPSGEIGLDLSPAEEHDVDAGIRSRRL